MSELNLNEFANLCDCYIQFSTEYPIGDPRNVVLVEFCQYVRSSTPFGQLAEQMKAFTIQNINVLKTGIVVEDEGDPSPGEIFNHDDAVIFLKGAGEKIYSFHFGILYALILERERGRKANDKRTSPHSVCLYALSVLSRCLRLAVNEAIPQKQLRESVEFNTYKKREFEILKSPYSSLGFEKIRKVASRYVRKYSKGIEGVAGEGRAEQIASIVEHADMKALTDGNTITELTSALSRMDGDGDDNDALEEVGKKLYSRVLTSVNKTLDDCNPDDQL